MEDKSQSENFVSQEKFPKTISFKDILTEDDRALLENSGRNLDALLTKIKAPRLEILERDFNGE